MIRPLLILAGVLAIGLCLQAEEPGDAGSAKLTYESWRIPPALVSRLDSNGNRQALPGFQWDAAAKRFDAREFIATFGISSPGESEAFLDADSPRLVVKNTPANIELLGAAFSLCGIGNPPSILAVSLAVHRCALPEPPRPDASGWPFFADLRKLPEKDFKLVSQVTGLTRSGERSFLKAVKGSREAAKDQPAQAQPADASAGFHPGESGIIASFELVASFETVFDLNLEFGWQSPASGGRGETIKFVTTFIATEDIPAIVYVAPSRDEPGLFNIVTATVRLTASGAWNSATFKAAGEEAKKLMKQRDDHSIPAGQ